jgi:hypothetical protein
VLTYVTLVFALTLGPWGLALITASPGAFPGTGDELTSIADLVGTASPALAGILVIASPMARWACATCDRSCSGGGWAFAGTRSHC